MEPEASELAELDLSFWHNETLPDARTGTCPLMGDKTAACIPLTKAKATPCPGHPDFELSEPVWAPFNVYIVFVVFVVPGPPSNMAQPNHYRAGPQGFADVCINIFIVSPLRRSPTGPFTQGLTRNILEPGPRAYTIIPFVMGPWVLSCRCNSFHTEQLLKQFVCAPSHSTTSIGELNVLLPTVLSSVASSAMCVLTICASLIVAQCCHLLRACSRLLSFRARAPGTW